MRGLKPTWTQAMLDALIEAYRTSPTPVIDLEKNPLFEFVTRHNITGQAHRMGLNHKSKWKWTKEMDELIMETYNKTPHPFKILKKHPLICFIPVTTIKKRAQKIGAVCTDFTRYSDEEKQLIIKHMELKKPREMIRILKKHGYNRTLASIRQFMCRNKLRAKTDTYSVRDVTEAFRVSDTTVVRWIRSGKLKIRSLNDTNQSYIIRPLNLAQFIVNHPFELESKRVDIPFMISLLQEFSGQL